MSLNRCEQRVYDYLQGHADERQHWVGKVQRLGREISDPHAAAHRLEGELWRYYEERSAVAQPFKDAVRHEGLRRTSLRNLAELLLRLWVEPRPKQKAGSRSPDSPSEKSPSY